MNPTGERLVLEDCDPDLRNEHLARYAFAEPLAAGKRVLDAGCGTGYGAARLAAAGGSVWALDNDDESLRDGASKYPAVQLVRGDCAELPFADDSLDLVVAFEVIEHLERWTDLIAEAARVLDPAGVFIVSTPNRPYYASSRDEPNPFHVHEFEHDEFRTALAGRFAHCELFIENHVPAVSLASSSASESRACFEDPSAKPDEAHFFVAACSMEPLGPLANVAYVPESGNVLRERELHIRKLNQWIATLEARHKEVEGKMSRELGRIPYRVLRRLRLAPRLPSDWLA